MRLSIHNIKTFFRRLRMRFSRPVLCTDSCGQEFPNTLAYMEHECEPADKGGCGPL